MPYSRLVALEHALAWHDGKWTVAPAKPEAHVEIDELDDLLK